MHGQSELDLAARGGGARCRRRGRSSVGRHHDADRLRAWPRSPPSCRSGSCTCLPCCSWRRSGVCGWASRRLSRARWRSTTSTSRRPESSRSRTESTGSRSRSSSSRQSWPASWPNARAGTRARPTIGGARRTCRPRWRVSFCGPTICVRRWPRAPIGLRPPSICRLHRSRWDPSMQVNDVSPFRCGRVPARSAPCSCPPTCRSRCCGAFRSGSCRHSKRCLRRHWSATNCSPIASRRPPCAAPTS